jgi:hypothetical protein
LFCFVGLSGRQTPVTETEIDDTSAAASLGFSSAGALDERTIKPKRRATYFLIKTPAMLLPSSIHPFGSEQSPRN